ncbi:hypothetical protein SOVF_185650 isoform A [Spinacia oleracea]|nr:hypothetical protein SOVF_185650 isoform A [Spinacia oleracea]
MTLVKVHTISEVIHTQCSTLYRHWRERLKELEAEAGESGSDLHEDEQEVNELEAKKKQQELEQKLRLVMDKIRLT